MSKAVDKKTLQAVIKALKIKVPIYNATRLSNGNIEVTTRNGVETWKPPAKKRQAAPKRKRAVAKPKSGGTK